MNPKSKQYKQTRNSRRVGKMQNEEKTKRKESEETLEGSHYRNWLRE
jgi:hypothetical protein